MRFEIKPQQHDILQTLRRLKVAQHDCCAVMQEFHPDPKRSGCVEQRVITLYRDGRKDQCQGVLIYAHIRDPRIDTSFVLISCLQASRPRVVRQLLKKLDEVIIKTKHTACITEVKRDCDSFCQMGYMSWQSYMVLGSPPFRDERQIDDVCGLFMHKLHAAWIPSSHAENHMTVRPEFEDLTAKSAM